MLNEVVQQKLITIEERLIDNIAENMRPLGIPTTVGRVLGIIHLNQAPMTLDELSEATGMSKTRMSQVVREMVEHNIAYKVYEKGVRKDIYNVEQDYFANFISILTTNWDNIIKKNRRSGKLFQEELSSILELEDLEDSLKQKAKELLAEINKWLNYYDWLDRFVNFLESDEIFKYVPR